MKNKFLPIMGMMFLLLLMASVSNSQITVTSVVTDASCIGNSDGEIDITPLGGVGNFTYLWSNNSEVSEDITGLSLGSYTVTVTEDLSIPFLWAQPQTDANHTVIIPGSSLLVDGVGFQLGDRVGVFYDSLGTLACGGYAEWTTLNVTQGSTAVSAWGDDSQTGVKDGFSPNEVFTWKFYRASDGQEIDLVATYNPVFTGGNFVGNGMTAIVSLTGSSSAPMTTTHTASVGEPLPISTTGLVSNVSTFGGSDGAVNLTVVNGVAPFSYNWSNSATTEDITGLSANTYDVTVTDANSCTGTGSYLVIEPSAVILTETITDVTCFGGTDGEISLSISGGTTPYTINWAGGASTNVISGLNAAVYNVTVTDFGGAVATGSWTVNEPLQISLTGAITDVDCNGNNNGAIVLTVTNGVSPFNYSWSNSETTKDISGLGLGTYTINVSDANSCTGNNSFLVIEPAILGNSGTLSDYSGYGVSAFGASDGTIDLTVSGGTSPYAYSWSPSATTQNLSGLAAGTYEVTITDANNCLTTGSFILTEPASSGLSVSGVVTGIDCNSNCNGAINLTVTGGQTPYTYLWSNGMTDQNISGLCDGSYQVTVTDDAGVVVGSAFDWTYTNTGANHTMFILDTSPMLIDGLAPVIGDYFGVFYIDGSGAPACGGYTQWAGSSTLFAIWGNDSQSATKDGFASGETFNWKYYRASDGVTVDLVATYMVPGTYPGIANTGTYLTQGFSGIASLTGTTPPPASANQGFASFTITEPDALVATGVEANVSCYNGSNGSIELTVSGGTTGYTFLWSNNATTEDITGLTAGNYDVVVTDANNCTTQVFFTITEPTAITVSGIESMVTCNGGSDGAITLTVSGGTSPYTYAWTGGMTSKDVSGLMAGSYTVTVTDALNCTATMSFTITEPDALVVTGIVTNLLCNGTQSGEIAVTVSGGVASYTYIWSTGATIEDLTGLAGGSYGLTVTDANLCTSEVSFSVIEPDAISISGTPTDVTCNGGSDGSIDIDISGGTGVYTYTWTGGLTTEDISGLTANTYEVVVTDANNCTATASYTVNEPLAIEATAIFSNISCFGYNDGSIMLNVTGGVQTYSYLWDNSATSGSLTGLIAGTYVVTITDSNLCTMVYSYTLTQPDLLEVTGSVTDLDCYGTLSGAIDISVTGGTTNYSYSWDNGATIDDLTGLAGGTYVVVVTDASQCTTSETFNVVEPSLFVASGVHTDVSCFNGNDGAIELTVVGGVPTYTYSWSNGATIEDLTGLVAGNYDVIVYDTNNCPAPASFVVSQPDLLTATATLSHISCNGLTDGTISISVTGGTSTYTYLWDDNSTIKDRSGLAAGTYSITITDAQGCSFTDSYTINEPQALALTDVVSNLLCNGTQAGEIDITVTGGTTSYSYLWEDGSTSEDHTGLTGGNYSVTVTDANGCQIMGTYSVYEPTVLSLTETSVNVSCFGGNDGSIDVTVSGGTSAYQYLWTNNATTNSISGLIAGDYTVTVTDANNCVIVNTYSISESTLLIATVVTTNVDCFGGNNGSAIITATGGTMPYNYIWTDGSTDPNYTGLIAGTYDLTVTDALGCTYIASYTITEPAAALQLTATVTDVTVLWGSDGTIDLTVTGGTMPYTYSWDNSLVIEDLFGLSEGTYTVIVTDLNGCTETISVYVNQPPSSPSWTFTNTGINHTILIPGTADLNIYGNAIQPGDYIGLFYDSLGFEACAGILAYNGGVAAIAAWGAQTGLVDGFAIGEEFKWKVWVAQTNTQYDMEATYIPAGSPQIFHEQYFATNGQSGITELLVSGGLQEIILTQQWNIVSTYLIPPDANMISIFANIAANISMVKDELGRPYWPAYGLNMIGNWESQEGYRVYAITPDTLVIEGEYINPMALPIDLPVGWSLFGYPRVSPGDAVIMLASVASNINMIKDQNGWVYWPAFGLNAIGDLKPGEGYAAYMSAASTLLFPANSANVAKSNLIRESNKHFGNINNTGVNMTIGLPVTSWDITPAYKDEIAVFNNKGILVGKAVYTDENLAIAVWGNDSETEYVDGMTDGEIFSLVIWSPLSNQERVLDITWVEGESTYETNSISVAGKISIIEDISFELSQNVPNPVRTTTEIQFLIAHDCNVELSLYNILGDKIEVISSGFMNSGIHTVTFDASRYSAGTYIYRIKAGDFISSKQLNIIK